MYHLLSYVFNLYNNPELDTVVIPILSKILRNIED